jgi:hypothetical protein
MGKTSQQNCSTAVKAHFIWWTPTDAVCASTRDGSSCQLPHSFHESIWPWVRILMRKQKETVNYNLK